jgi:hypothetical protein
MEHIPPNVERWWGLAAGSFHLAPLSPLAMIKQKRDENRGTGCLEWAIFLCQLRSITSISERQTLSSFKREFVEVSIAGRDENPPAGHNGWTAVSGLVCLTQLGRQVSSFQMKRTRNIPCSFASSFFFTQELEGRNRSSRPGSVLLIYASFSSGQKYL